MSRYLILEDSARSEICNLLAGAIARHTGARDQLLATWKRAYYLINKPNQKLLIELTAGTPAARDMEMSDG